MFAMQAGATETMPQLMIEQHQKVVATFLPKRFDDLQEWAKPLIGKRLELYAAWPIEEGQFAAEMAFISTADPPTFHGWVPESDLVAVEVIV